MMKQHLLLSIAVIILVTIILIILTQCRKTSVKARKIREQIDRKLKEDDLDRVLSNGPQKGNKVQAETPVKVHYTSNPYKKGRSMLRLVDQAGYIEKEYIFLRTDILYIGEEYGHSVIFREQSGNQVYCELFPHQDSVYVRLCGKAKCRLIRGKQSVSLTSNAVRLHNGDKIETQAGVFLVELL